MKHLLIDANNLLYRGYHVSKLTDRKGNRVSGVFNCMRMVNTLLRKFKPDTVVIAWDLGKSKSRLAIYPDYKQQRDKNRKEEDKIAIQQNKDMLIKLFSYLPVRQIMVQDIEADDIIGWLANDRLKGKKIIISNDSDFIQLVKKDTLLFLPHKGKLLTKRNIDEFLGFPAKHYTLWKSMVGDHSDNIKGIRGIGPKKATAIILNGVGEKKKLPINDEEQKILDRNKYLIAIGAILQDDDVKQIKKAWKKAKEDSTLVRFSQIRKIFRQLDFKTLLYQIDDFEIRFLKITRKGKNEKKEKVKKGKTKKRKKFKS